MTSGKSRVTVSVRVRPKLAFAANALQQNERYEEVICIPTSESTLRLVERRVNKVQRNMHFAYDNVFDVDTTQEEVYETAALDGVDSVLGGTNASFLTYGQTGSGKTFTVLGKTAQQPNVSGAVCDIADEVVCSDTGLLLRAIQDMLNFAETMRQKKERHVVLGITAIEIYNDEIRDLLRVGGRGGPTAPLQPIMTRDTLHFPGLTHLPLRSLRDACTVYERAAARRVQRATSANDASSRSHAIFTVEVFQTPMTPSRPCPPTLEECCALRDAAVPIAGRGSLSSSASLSLSPLRHDVFDGAPKVVRGADGAPVMCSALTVADLAGSEKAKHADVHGAGFDELRRINASLTALGNVVHHLYHGSAHVPYRDSKLTMVLRDTFAAPHARVMLFVNVSPTAITCEETLSSLYFADKMKGMTVPDTEATPQQASLQTSYLASLRTHDAILAEMHVFHIQQELSAGAIPQKRAANHLQTQHEQHLMQLPYHVACADSQEKVCQLQQLCAELKAEVAQAESPENRMQRLAEATRREERNGILKKYSRRRAEVHILIAKAEQANALLTQELTEAEAAMRQSLNAAKAAAQQAVATRQELSKRKTKQQAALEALSDDAVAASSHGSCHSDAVDVDSNHSGNTNCNSHRLFAPDEPCSFAWETEGFDDVIGHTLRNALAVAELRSTLVELVAFNVRTEPAPTEGPNNTSHREGSEAGAASRSEKSRSPGGTVISLDRKHATMEEWLRGAVLAMAGNAVVQSFKRKSKAQKQQRPGQQPLKDVTNVQAFTASSHKTSQLPKFWKVMQQRSDTLHHTTSEGKDDAAVANETEMAAEHGVRRIRSSFDNPALFTRVTAYMDMGALLVKVDRTGHPRPRWFYLAQKEDRYMLCWDESRRVTSLSGGGHVYLDTVEKIILGRSSPGFLKYAKVHASTVNAQVKENSVQEEEKDVCNSFTIVYHTRVSHGDFKFVDIICPNKIEFETWVLGLTHWAGVSPVFEDARQPDNNASTAAEDDGKVSGKESSLLDGLSAQEAVLCRAWHVSPTVLMQTKNEMAARRFRHHSAKMRLTPGELRDLTGLDIFRASALWLHCAKAGWVVNPTEKLCCFVGDIQPCEVAKEAVTAAQ